MPASLLRPVRRVIPSPGPATDPPPLPTRAPAAPDVGALYEAHAAAMLRVAWRITGERTEAEDVVHDVFVALPALLARHGAQERPDAWLRAVTGRVALDRLRRERRRAGLLARFGRVEAIAGGDAPSADATSMDLDRALARLSPSLRTVFVLRHLHDLAYDDIARVLDSTPGAVRVQFLRATRRLRQLMEA